MNQNTQDAINAAATKAADLWIDYIDRAWDNGDPMSNLFVSIFQEQVDCSDKTASFHEHLIGYIKAKLNHGDRRLVHLGTDYGPGFELREIIQLAGIAPMMLPCKTFVRVAMTSTEITVSGKCGYYSEIETTTYPINDE